METTFSITLVLPFLLIFVVMGLICFTALYDFRRWEKLKVKRRDETSRSFLQNKIPSLLPWEPSKALCDLSSLCVRIAESSAISPWSHCRGTARSLRSWHDSWLAFTVNTQKREGSIVLHTSANEIIVTVRRGVPLIIHAMLKY